MTKSQLWRLSKVLIIPFIAIGLFLANSALNKKIIIYCSISNSASCYGFSEDLYQDEEIRYKPFLVGESIDVRITPINKLIFKKINVYSLTDYENSNRIVQAYNNGVAGYIRTLINPNINRDEYFYGCIFSRYNDDLFESSASNRICINNYAYFTFVDYNTDQLMRSIDYQAIDIYKKKKAANINLSILLFLSPFICFILLIAIVLLFKKIKNYVING